MVVLQRDDAPLAVVFRNADAIGHAEWLVLREDSCAAIPFLLGIVPIALIAVESDVQLTLLHLGLLQAEEVGVQRLEDFAEALTVAGPQPIHIP